MIITYEYNGKPKSIKVEHPEIVEMLKATLIKWGMKKVEVKP